MNEPTRPRPPTGGALLRAPVTDAITRAALDELAESGYAGMSMEAVARRARVGKAALYRRWNSKQEMVEQIVAGLSWHAVPVPDTGSLRGDVDSYLAHAAALRQDLQATRIIADLSAEAIRNPRLAQVFATALREPRRAAGTAMLRRAVERGELPADLDAELALDCLVALAHARPQALTASGELADPYPRDNLVEVVLTALAACRT
ncbi:TetR family transcriptional regulator [Actinocatenispora thailandica]|uniref:TetR family transcriptional regulator n=1 Tax=Actinocatenispora thailandica TaxID=227318 RepID=A0A7R7DX88_9ACTN|nr:TetR/AcrR family transcriptional regulator [Actinocatenispora thailandica]BCJ39275.1 TetR family transcriptional regulator [Actinocatenispora thailandica]